ncbi:MAG: hypothetical protein NT116_06370 [Candidatus Parcubacteria bacterium]|nr:hypothetical protein [Candidatus Parcubacteria bacterium]
MTKNPNKQFIVKLQRLRLERVYFLKISVSKSQIIKRIGDKFGAEILSHVKPVRLYGVSRYLYADIKKYLDKSSQSRNIFIELVGGQSCFLPPINKHRQGKLFIKS